MQVKHPLASVASPFVQLVAHAIAGHGTGVGVGAGGTAQVVPPSTTALGQVQGSPGGHAQGGVTVVVPPPSAQLQTQSAATVPSASAGHAQAHVEPELQPEPPSLQSHAHGGQISPGAHAAQAHVHAPPEPPDPLVPPPEQSHSTAGTVPLAFELIGLTHAQSVPPWSRLWQ